MGSLLILVFTTYLLDKFTFKINVILCKLCLTKAVVATWVNTVPCFQISQQTEQSLINSNSTTELQVLTEMACSVNVGELTTRCRWCAKLTDGRQLVIFLV